MRLLEAALRAHRIFRKSPTYVAERLIREVNCELDRWLAPIREKRLDRTRLIQMGRAASIDELWERFRARPYPAVTTPLDASVLDQVQPGESNRVLQAAERACGRIVDLLGIGPVSLGSSIDWAYDYRVNLGWPSGFARSIDYVNRDRPSDIKIPWEISRLQWVIPAGQAYLLTGDERYASASRDILQDWINKNPLAYTVNWSCTMEAALRLFTWSWLFHVFGGSSSWSDETFRTNFLASLYLHADFTRRHIEKADINGNHYTADLAGLVVAGHFFGDFGDAPFWRKIGWAGLQEEIGKQVFADGIDYEASCPYHRLVLELFLWPALFRIAAGETVPGPYIQRLLAMSRFVAAYMRFDGSSPLWGDADDARTLPFEGQALGDHRYLIGMAGVAFNDKDLISGFGGSLSELIWIFGPRKAASLPVTPSEPMTSAAFPDGGVYVMRHGNSHVFIDCGPLGLAGRGGHGHNDALSFEAWLRGAPLIIDRGSFVYTASFEDRNAFRATASHNTPCIDREEINRFDPGNLWSMQNDARAECTRWESDGARDVFVGTHHGYERLGVSVEREIVLDKRSDALTIMDRITGEGQHDVTIPLHLAPGVLCKRSGESVRLFSAGLAFDVTGAGEGWQLAVEPTTISPSYGVVLPSHRLLWNRIGALPADLTVTITPAIEADRSCDQ